MTRPKALSAAAIVFSALAWAIAVAQALPASAQPAAPSAVRPMPAVPTSKVLAVGRLTAAATPQAMRATMPQEVRDTVTLYLNGKIDQWFVRTDRPGVVFILNVANAEEARAILAKLPLGRAGLMEFDLTPLGPLAPLGLLLGPAAPPTPSP
jgi:hypothetical protein